MNSSIIVTLTLCLFFSIRRTKFETGLHSIPTNFAIKIYQPRLRNIRISKLEEEAIEEIPQVEGCVAMDSLEEVSVGEIFSGKTQKNHKWEAKTN